MLSRRSFAKSAVVLVAAPAAFTLQGCVISEAELKSDALTLAGALTSLATAIQGADPTIAADLTKAATGLTDAADAPSTGIAWEDALNAAAAGAEGILALIPATALFAPLIAIAVTALEAILGNTTTTASASSKLKAERLSLTPEQATNLVFYIHAGNAIVRHHAFHSPKRDFKDAWNPQAKDLGYPSAVIA
jgi:hypothetical protein